MVTDTDRFLPYARKSGKLYHAKEKAGLFIMFKIQPGTPDTDEGWVYGTATADATRVTSAGVVAACIHCHRMAGPDRLFGYAPAKGMPAEKEPPPAPSE
jgi:hypothetical protein